MRGRPRRAAPATQRSGNGSEGFQWCRLLLRRAFKCSEEGLNVPRAVISNAVYEKRRCAVDAAFHTAQEIFMHTRLVDSLLQLAHKLCCIETQLMGKLGKMPGVKGSLIFVKQIMHLPKFALFSCCLRALRCGLGMRMELSKWKVAKDEAKFVAHYLLNLFDNEVCGRAVRALEVTVLD